MDKNPLQAFTLAARFLIIAGFFWRPAARGRISTGPMKDYRRAATRCFSLRHRPFWSLAHSLVRVFCCSAGWASRSFFVD